MAEVSLHTAPLVTVLLPAYNSAAHLGEAIHSVLAQTHRDLELLVIDDGSTDATPQLMATITDPRVRYIRHERNRGLVAVLNEGLELARGAYVARMDGDDVMRPRRLAEQVRTLNEDPGVAVVAGTVDLIDADGRSAGVWATDRSTLTEAGIRRMMPRTNCIAHPSVMIRRSALGGLRYNPAQPGAEDWDLWLRMLARGARIVKIDTPLLDYRIHPASVMAGSKREVPLEIRLMRARHRHLVSEWSGGHLYLYQWRIMLAQLRTLARHLVDRLLPTLARNAHRLLTYSPFKLMQERRALRKALADWDGHHAFVFSYLNTGGAEQVHADIMATVADQHPIVFITGFSKDRGFAGRFAQSSRLVEIPRLLHHPLTARAARRKIVAAINLRPQPVLFGANTDHFARWCTDLEPGVRTIQLIHAFLHQPDGNHKHRAWLPLFGRMDRYVLIADQARKEFEKFLQASHVPASSFGKLITIPNAVHGFGRVEPHPEPGILFVGRDSSEKRLDLFLRIADEVQRSVPGLFRFTVMGAAPRNGHHHVQFLGTITDPAARDRVYAAHDILVLTSAREGFPMVIMEAMAQGLAIISTPVGDVPGRVDARFGIVTTSTAPDAVFAEMTQAIEQLGRKPDHLQTMRTAALDEARSSFGMDRFRARYRALLISPEADK